MSTVLELSFDHGYLKLTVLGFEVENAQNHDDANWLKASIELKASGLFAGFKAALTTYDLIELQRVMTECINQVGMSFDFYAEEDSLHIQLIRTITGAVVVNIECRDFGPPKLGVQVKSETDTASLERAREDLALINNIHATRN